MAIAKTLVSSSKQLLNLWRSSMSRRGMTREMQEILEGTVGKRAIEVHSKAKQQLSPKILLQEINQAHQMNRIPGVLPKIKVQEAGMAKLQAGRNNPKPLTRLANKAESSYEKKRRLGCKTQTDPSVREY